MQTVNLEERKYINILLYILNRHEMAARIQMNSAITKAGRIFHTYKWRLPNDSVHLRRTFDFGRQELHKGLHSVEETLYRPRCHVHTLFRNLQQVAFVVRHIYRFVQRECDISLIGHLHSIPCCCIHLCSKEFGNGTCFRSSGTDSRLSSKFEIAIVLHEALRHRNDVDALIVRQCLCLLAAARCQQAKGSSGTNG